MSIALPLHRYWLCLCSCIRGASPKPVFQHSPPPPPLSLWEVLGHMQHLVTNLSPLALDHTGRGFKAQMWRSIHPARACMPCIRAIAFKLLVSRLGFTAYHMLNSTHYSWYVAAQHERCLSLCHGRLTTLWGPSNASVQE